MRKLIALGALLLSACAGDKIDETHGRDGTVAYFVKVESSEPGARIEADGDSIGKTPLTLKIYGDPDGTFHNFGRAEYVVKAYPANPNQPVQYKIFKTGGNLFAGNPFTEEDRIPTTIYFDFTPRNSATGRNTGGFTIDLPTDSNGKVGQ